MESLIQEPMIDEAELLRAVNHLLLLTDHSEEWVAMHAACWLRQQQYRLIKILGQRQYASE